MESQSDDRGTPFVRPVIEVAIRLGLVVVMVVWCFDIVRPFLVPILWGMIIAVATYPGYQRLEAALDGRSTLAAAMVTVLALAVLIGPSILLADTVIEGARGAAAVVAEGDLKVPPPPAEVAGIPVIGDPLAKLWLEASQNLGATLARFGPQLRDAGGWLVSTAAGVGFGLLQFAFAIVIAGVLLANAAGGEAAARAIAVRVAGEPGLAFAGLATATVRNVARGILGVALIQALLAGLGFLFVGLPGAGLLALVCLLLAVIQIGVGPVLIPAIIYVFYTMDTTTAVLFLLWSVPVLVADNVLRPILLGRGAPVPMAVIFLGAIGGFLWAGIIGLFVGAVILSLGYTLFRAWLYEDPTAAADPAKRSGRPDPATGQRS